ncbi:MAG: hypothetical protein UR73_C0008G0001, partial [candidate division WS6 bacterium GW2011_GWF1_35_23]
NEIKKIINRGELWGEISCIDIYSKDNKDLNKKITFRVILRHSSKTLNNKDISEIIGQIGRSLKNKFKAVII